MLIEGCCSPQSERHPFFSGTQFRNESFLSERQEYPGQDFIYCEERKVRGEA